MTGHLKRRTGAPYDRHQTFMFRGPDYITTETIGRIFVTDRATNIATCMTVTGDAINQYKEEEMWGPTGVFAAHHGTIVVCDFSSNNLVMLSPSSEKLRELITVNDGAQHPLSASYRHTDNMLVVVCDKNDKLFVFQLKPL